MIFCGKASLYLGEGAPMNSAHSEGRSGNQPECCENLILCEIHRIWDKIQLFSRKGHTLAIHKTHKKPNHKYLHPCLLEPKPWQWLEAAPAQIRARIPAAIPTLHQHPVGTGSKATTPRIKQQP